LEDVAQVHGIPVFTDGHQCARSSKRAGGLIPRIALDQCRVPERYRTRVPMFVPIAQNTEQTRPKRQVAGEIPGGGRHFTARGSRGTADPPDSESGSLGRASRLAPTIFKALKPYSAMHSLGKRTSSVQFRVGAPFFRDRSRASAQAGVISQPCPGQHWGLRGISMQATMRTCLHAAAC
jgi:hypothetical protein